MRSTRPIAACQEIFYQVFDKGTLRDGEGRDIDFKNTTIVMTANAGSELLAALAADPDTMPEGEALEALLLPELQKHFKPAFLGRTIDPALPAAAARGAFGHRRYPDRPHK